MKQLFFFFSIFVFVSCGGGAVIPPLVITDLETNSQNCYAYLNSTNNQPGGWFSMKIPCNTYKIGDTIYLIEKKIASPKSYEIKIAGLNYTSNNPPKCVGCEFVNGGVINGYYNLHIHAGEELYPHIDIDGITHAISNGDSCLVKMSNIVKF